MRYTGRRLDSSKTKRIFKGYTAAISIHGPYDLSNFWYKTMIAICMISFALAPLSCSEQKGSEKFKMKIYVFSGIRTHARHSTTGKSALKTARLHWLYIKWSFIAERGFLFRWIHIFSFEVFALSVPNSSAVQMKLSMTIHL